MDFKPECYDLNKNDFTRSGYQHIFDKIQSYQQSYFNWVYPIKLYEGGATTTEIINILENRFLEMKTHIDISLKYNSIELIADKGSLAYINICTNKIIEGKTALAEARRFIQLCSEQSLVDEEYLDGFDYVLDCLDIYTITNRRTTNRTIFELEKYILLIWQFLPSSYESLTSKSQAAVLAMKFYFYRQLRKDFNEQLEIVAQMIKLDPNYFEWHSCKGTILKYKRKQERYYIYKPYDPAKFEEERIEIELAKYFSPPNNPKCMLDYCELIAEMGKRLKPNSYDWRTPLCCGIQIFVRIEDMVNFLKDQIKKILEIYDKSVRVNLTIADIFTKWLPNPYKNFELAENCLQRALNLYPKSSKANHRLANYYMAIATWQDPESMIKAEMYCIIAVKYDPRNCPAVLDLIQIYLGNLQKNHNKLKDMLDIYMNKSLFPLSPRITAALLFFKGLFLHLKSGHELEAVDNWIKAQEILKDNLQFDELNFSHYRYKWPTGHFSFQKLRGTIKYAMKYTEFCKEKAVAMEELMNCLDRAEAETKHHELKKQITRNASTRGRRCHADFQEKNWRKRE